MQITYHYFSLLLFLSLTSTSVVFANENEASNIEQTTIIRDSLIQTYFDFDIDRLDEVVNNLHEALELNELIPDDKKEALCHYALGYTHRRKGNIKLAIKYQKLALKNYTKLNLPGGIISALNELATLYKRSGEFEQAVKYYTQAAEIAKATNDKHLQELNHNIASMYNTLNKPDMAIKFLTENLKLKKDSALYFSNYINLGNAYKKKENDSIAMFFYKKALANGKKYNRSQIEMNELLFNMSDVLIRTGYVEQALDDLLTIKEYNEANDQKSNWGFVCLSLSKIYQKMGIEKYALSYAQKSIKLAQETNSNDDLLKGYLHLSNLLKYESNFKESDKMLRLYIQLNDSLFNIETRNRSEQLLAEFDAERKENEILLLRKEQQLNEKRIIIEQQEAENQKMFRNIALLLTCLIVIVTIVIIVFYQQKMRNHNLLVTKNEELNRQKILDLIKNHDIKAIRENLNGREKERKRIAKELHDGIGGNLASIKMQLRKIIENENHCIALHQVMQNIDSTYYEVRDISHNLTPIKIVSGDFSGLVANYTANIQHSTSININLQIFPEDDFNAIDDTIKIEVYRILQELLNNILKHAHAKNVEVLFTLTDENLNMLVEDDGIGFNVTGDKFSGIGLENIKSRLKILNGTLHVDSSVGRGTIINMDIPTCIEALV